MDVRVRKANFNGLVALSSQFLNIAIGIVSVPLIVSYLGSEKFGLLMTLTSIITLIAFSDLGIGIGVQDRVSVELANGNPDEAKRYLYSALVFILFVALALCIIIELGMLYFDFYAALSKSNNITRSEINGTVRVVFYSLVVGLISGIFQRIFIAIQEGYIPSIILLIARATSLVLLIYAVNVQATLPALALVMNSVAPIVMLVSAPVILLLTQKWIRVNSAEIFHYANYEHIKNILKIGSVGVLASVCMYIVGSSSQFIIGARHSLHEAAVFATLLKLTSVPVLIITVVTSSYWPAITDAFTKKDTDWIYKTKIKMRRLAYALSISFSLIVAFGHNWIILSWTGLPDLLPDAKMVFAVIIMMILLIFNAYYSVFLNGFSMYKSQGTYLLVLAMVFFLWAYFSPVGFGASAPILITATGLFIRCVFMSREINDALCRLKAMNAL